MKEGNMEYAFKYVRLYEGAYSVWIVEEESNPIGAEIGEVYKETPGLVAKEYWLAYPPGIRPNSLFNNSKQFPSRQAASIWLMGIVDAKSEWLNALRAQYLLRNG